MKLYWTPRSCAMGIAALLEEVGAPFETILVDIPGGEMKREPFASVNPKGKVPVLVRGDGTILTEFGTIARWIARTHPRAHLVPDDAEVEARASEMMDYAIDTLHGQGFQRLFFPARFCKDPAHEAAVKEDGKAIVAKALAHLAEGLGAEPYAAGPAFSIADAALFYNERWAEMMKLPLPEPIAAHFARLKARPAFEAALARAKG